MKKIIFLILFFMGCKEVLPPSVGRSRDILVVTPYKDSLEIDISFVLEEIHYTPQPEKEFKLKYIPLDKFEAYSRYHAIFLLLLPKDAIYQKYFKGLKTQDEFTLYKMDTVFAKNQTVLLLVGKDIKSLRRGIRKYRETIRYIFKQRLLKRLYAYTFIRGYNQTAMEKVKKYGFFIQIPKNFVLVEKNAPSKFIYLVAHNPDRNIFIYWQEKPRKIEPERLFPLRDSLTAFFYDGDYVERSLSTFREWNFKGYKGYRLEGVWQNERFTIGGPFVSYVFSTDKRFYFIDGIVFEPGKKKLSFLNQVEVILSTFEP